MEYVCEEVTCSSPATIFFSEFSRRTCVADRRFCEVHASSFLASFYPHPHALAEPARRLDGAAAFAVGSTIYDAEPAYSEQPVGYVHLAEIAGPRELTVAVGGVELWTLRDVLMAPPPIRPLAHQAILGVIDAVGGELDSVLIDRWDEGSTTYYAKLRIIRDARLVQSDVRPSDALIVAVLADAPIFVSEAVLAANR